MNLLRVSKNKFVAVDDDGKKAGTASISRLNQERIFPDRPIQFEINVSGDSSVKTLLYSTATTRARMLARKETQPCRVYTVLEPGDTETLNAIKLLGYKVYDGIIRTSKSIDVKGYCEPLPAGMTLVSDHLKSVGEFRKCLVRYNDCFGKNAQAAWLEDIMKQPDFIRFVVVDENGLCGELLAWSRGSAGVIGIIQTARQSRRQGVAANLIEAARCHFRKLGMTSLSFDVWRTAPGCIALAEGAGFTGLHDGRNVITIFPEIGD